ncbi:MAG: DUF2782 domain-containing protein [Magnetococcales bacterium]|nr:DUF2782 domain-containing protein [Magnetococcales bacterium]
MRPIPPMLPSDRTTPTPRRHSIPSGGGGTAALLALILALALCPTGSLAAEKAKPRPAAAQTAPAADPVPQDVPEEVSRRDEGFPIPRKGPLISELRESTDPESKIPETVIRRYEDYKGNTVREYLINGMLFQIEVIPTSGPPYYLIDVEGNGLFQERHVGYQPRLVVPQWVLFRF